MLVHHLEQGFDKSLFCAGIVNYDDGRGDKKINSLFPSLPPVQKIFFQEIEKTITKMKLKHLQSALSSIPIKQFPNPKIALEQYATSPELASHVIHYALNNDDIGDESSVLDLGCGTGMLAMGCAIVGTKRIICVDCDEEAIQIAQENVEEMEFEVAGDDDVACVFEFILAQVKHTPSPSLINSGGGQQHRGRGGRGRGKSSSKGRGRQQQQQQQHVSSLAQDTKNSTISKTNEDDGVPLKSNCVDTVLTNPPFGTKNNAGIDVSFLKIAIRLATKAVYSFHKSSTSLYLIKTIQSWGYEAEVVAQMKFDIPKMYKFHKKDEVDVEVDLIRVSLVL